MSVVEVAVVGAGLAGLTAAAALKEAGCRPLVWEARHCVGGRVEAFAEAAGVAADAGGQFFCEDMPQIASLARAHGKTFVRSADEGEATVHPPVPAGGNAAFSRSWALREKVRALEPHDPGLAGLSVSGWAERQGEPADVVSGFLSMIEGLWCVDPRRLSLPFLAANYRRVTNRASELQFFLAEGMQSLAEDLAAPLSSELRLGEAVLGIAQDAQSVTLTTSGGQRRAAAALIAVPPATARRIAFGPQLPADLAQALAAWTSGDVAKLVIAYDRPFWRDRGLSGIVAWREPAGLFACDASLPGGPARLVMFMAGRVAQGSASTEDLRRFALGKLAEALGDEAARPTAVQVRNWSGDRWSGGGYADVILDEDGAGVEDRLRQGWGRVHFASSELSPSFPGYIEGAIVAGREGAARILDLLHVAK